MEISERGLDFLGFHFTPDELSVAGKTIEKVTERIARLYEQGVDLLRIGQYIPRWLGWSKAGHLGAGKICRAVLVEKILPYNTKCGEILSTVRTDAWMMVFKGFKRYVSLSILAKNLQIIGYHIQQKGLKQLQRSEQRKAD